VELEIGLRVGAHHVVARRVPLRPDSVELEQRIRSADLSNARDGPAVWIPFAPCPHRGIIVPMVKFQQKVLVEREYRVEAVLATATRGGKIEPEPFKLLH
jgi:hypothetical protein